MGLEKGKTLLERDSVTGPFVVGGKPGRVGGLCHLALENLLEGVGALARGGVDIAHEMHLDVILVCRVLLSELILSVGCLGADSIVLRADLGEGNWAENQRRTAM